MTLQIERPLSSAILSFTTLWSAKSLGKLMSIRLCKLCVHPSFTLVEAIGVRAL